jgi:hypothetical protein
MSLAVLKLYWMKKKEWAIRLAYEYNVLWHGLTPYEPMPPVNTSGLMIVSAECDREVKL